MATGKDFLKPDIPSTQGHGDLLTQQPILRRRYRLRSKTWSYSSEWEPNFDIAQIIQNEVNDLEERVKVTEDEINVASQRAHERTENIELVMDAIINLLKRFQSF
ncbi:hypothetical protein C0993_010932 [Termitomyces sp. T159_Od127]|nr:hypothetical protein C0993_010932 [Termitomyces sp. T159_Od127]